jgi:hypothetical protein
MRPEISCFCLQKIHCPRWERYQNHCRFTVPWAGYLCMVQWPYHLPFLYGEEKFDLLLYLFLLILKTLLWTENCSFNGCLHNIYSYCYMLGFLGGMTYASCSISIVTQQFYCVTVSLLHFHGNVTVWWHKNGFVSQHSRSITMDTAV